MTDATATLPPEAEGTPYGLSLFESVCTQHGGRAELAPADLETVLVIVRLHGDARAATDPMHRVRILEAIARAHELLPAAPKPEPTHLDLSLLSDEELATLEALMTKGTVVG